MSADRAPLVLVHGQLMTRDVWAPLLPALEARGPVHIADVESDDSIAAMAARLLAEMPERFDLLGFAMGGFVALEVMRRAPGRVRRLVLLATLAEADTPAQIARRQGYADLVEAGRFAEVAEERIPILFGPAARSDAALVATAKAMAEAVGAETFLRQQRAIIGRPDSCESLSAIACPALVLRGEEDGITSEDHHARLVRSIPRARGGIIGSCGHLVPLERPDELAERLARWL